MTSKKYYNGSRWLQDCGDYLTVVGHKGGNNLIVKFDNSPEFNAQMKEVKNGKVYNRNNKSVAGEGFIGYGTYSSSNNNLHTKSYQVWRDMLRRCYDSKSNYYKNYGEKGVIVCEEWKNYQTYAKWYDENSTSGWVVDKDLIDYREKIYSPNTCSFVPICINSLFTGGFSSIVYLKQGKWVVQLQKGEKCSNGKKKQSYFGVYTCKEEALEIYFTEKMAHITEVVEPFKDELLPVVVENLLNRVWVKDYIKYLRDE